MGDKKITLKELVKMNSQESCQEAISNGWKAAIVSLSLTLIFSISAFFTQSDDAVINYFLDPYALVDVALMAILAFFIYKKSRTAATIMFIYFVFSKCMQWYDIGAVKGLPFALVFIFFYFNAMRGTFIWHSNYKKTANQES